MSYFKNIIKGLAIATVCTIIGIISLAIILSKCNVNESSMRWGIITIFCISILAGTIISAESLPKNGAIVGGLMTICYVVAMYIVSSSIIGNFSLNVMSIVMIISSFLVGCLGGMIGINIK